MTEQIENDIANFNSTSTFEIIIKDYYDNTLDYNECMQNIILDLNQGNIDCIQLDNLPYNLYTRHNLLYDLSNFFNNDDEIQLKNYTFNSNESNYVAAGFILSCIVGDQLVFQNIDNQGFTSLIEALILLREPVSMTSPLDFLNLCLTFYTSEFYSDDGSTLNTYSISKLLEYCLWLHENDADYTNVYFALLPDFIEYQVFEYMLQNGTTALSSSLQYLNQFAIASESKNKDEAWQFIKMYLDVDYQYKLVGSGLLFPTELSVLNKMAIANSSSDYEDNVKGYGYVGDNTIELYPSTEEHIEKIYYLINNNRYVYCYNDLLSIVLFYAEQYFDGELLCDEAVLAIENSYYALYDR